ncbi:hypothetical protein SAMN05421747_11146 [Parapedobacter composti]|uniref:Probable sensor domain-containing protein n=1 Tax=Parapedobacter composti TaxID=623281 RepID=A0A1I1JE33_9SPHI|nr:hypothetical protein [Parapedobacter composti]SFC44223.1 hypothetical protein SAMN05421747_11146 [Parapedobacter composti]
MISEPTYLAARLVSHRIAAHFGAATNQSPIPQAYIPDTVTVEALLDAAFWASLRKEEGYEPKISLVFAAPEFTGDNLVFHTKQRLTPHHLVKLSPAVVQPGIHLGIWLEGDDYYIWGTTHDVPPQSMVVEVVEAGLLIVKQRHGYSTGKFINVAVLNGNQIKVIDDNHWGLADSPGILSSLLGLPREKRSDNLLVQFALAMRKHGRGALLLIVPQASTAWLHSIVKPVNYFMVPQEATVPGDASEANATPAGSLRKMVDAVGGYSAIDGATVITQDHRLLAFGAKVARSPHAQPVEQLMVTEPIEGNTLELLDATKIGGTRHLAAAQFVHDQRDSLAMVASQDGTFTVFSWSDRHRMVHAHRIDVLLM